MAKTDVNLKIPITEFTRPAGDVQDIAITSATTSDDPCDDRVAR
jgi:hypothetical protein